MPQAVAHILIPLILLSLFRDYYIKRKGRKRFPLNYVFIAGISGIIPDLDVAAFWILNFFGYTYNEIHRTFMHSVFIPLIFVVLALLFVGKNMPWFGRHKLKLNIIFWMIALGSFSHLILDAIFSGQIMPFYPFSYYSIGLNLFDYLPNALRIIAAPSLDAGLLIIWLIYIEWKHKISDFI